MQNDELLKLSESIIEEYRKITKTNYNPTINEYLDIRNQAIKEYEFIEPRFDVSVENNVSLERSSLNNNNNNNNRKSIDKNTEKHVSQSYSNNFQPVENLGSSYSENTPNGTNFINGNNFETDDSQLSDFEMLKRIKDPWN